MNILVADDALSMRECVSRELEREGHHCDVASDGKECLKKMAHNLYDVLLLDLFMPEVDGIQVLRSIKGRFPGTDVVIISAQDDEAVIQETIDLGAIAYLLKPAGLKTYISLIQKIAADRQKRSTEAGIRKSLPLDA